MSELKKAAVPEGLKAFTHLGLLTAQEARAASGANFALDCPFCGAEKAMGVALEPKVKLDRTIAPGMWNCFRCGEAGNTASLIQKVYTLAKSEGNHDLAPLAKDRNLPIDILQVYGIVPSLYTDQWWLPIFNEIGTLINLYRYDILLKQQKSSYAFLGCPGCSAGLFNVQTLYAPPPGSKLSKKELETKRIEYPVYMAEGHWDTIALDHILRESGQRATCDVIGAPGANSVQAAWFRFFPNRPLYLLFDHDPPKEINGRTIQPGWDGVQRTIKLAKQSTEYKPSSINVLEWSLEKATHDRL